MQLSSDVWVENRPTAGRRALDWRELWRYRELVGFLAARDIKVRYKQAAFGMLWAVLQPLSGLVVFSIVFGKLAKVPSEGVPYPLFAFAGMMVWTLFSGGVDTATTSLVSNSALVTKVYFPRVAAPLASVLPRLVDFVVALGLFAVLLVVQGHLPGWHVIALPLVVVWAVLLAFGVGLGLATLQVRYRDAHHGLTLLMQLWLYASPVAYPSSLVPHRWLWLYALNPMVGVLDTARWSVLGTPAPGLPALLSLAVGAAVLGVGVSVFARNERRFADII